MELITKISKSDDSWHLTKIKLCDRLCIDSDDILGTFTDAFLSLLLFEDFRDSRVKTVKDQLTTFLESILDKFETDRLDFFLRILVSMEQVATKDDKDKIVTFLSCATYILASKLNHNPDIHSSLWKHAIKSLARYLSESSNFLAIQAVIEMLNILQIQGFDVNLFLPHFCSPIIKDIQNLPSQADFLKFRAAIAFVTRKLISEVLKERNIKIFALKGEMFMNEKVPSGHDLFLYYQPEEHIFNHVTVFPSERRMYMETIVSKSIQLDEDLLLVKTDHWKFVVQGIFIIDLLIQLILSLSFKA